MGNTPSVEAPKKSSKAGQKLSKPRIGNPATAGLLSPGGVSDIIRPSPSTTTRRRFSLPYSSTSIPSPRHPETDQTALDDLAALYGASAPVEDCAHPLFRPDPQTLHQGSQSGGVVASSSRSRRASRADSAYMGADEGYEQAQLDLAASSPRNYDFSSYEAKQLLNLVEATPFEDQSIASESQFPLALSRRQSYTTPYHPVHPDAATLLPRANSDASLYTPMRRRSLMTPGVATRPVPADLTIPPEIQTRHGLGPTLSRCDSPDSMEAGLLSVPHLTFDPSLLPRAHTPCETEYQQTGAFKHGTLRITNGSPAITPAWEASDDGLHAKSSITTMRQASYFDDGSQVEENQGEAVSDSHQPIPSFLIPAPSATIDGDQGFALDFLPELKLSLSPFSINGIEPGSPELQTTSKHTAIEDELFEDGLPEFGAEVLNLRLDHDTQPQSSSPGAPPGERKQKVINRSDSGIVVSPTPTAPHKALSKADSGYSSSVSIRSLSSKRIAQQELSNPRNLEPISPQASAFENTDQSDKIPTRTNSITIGSLDSEFQTPAIDEPPPPVPEKDHSLKVQKVVTVLPDDSSTIAKDPSLVSNRTPADEAPQASHHSTVGLNDPPASTANSNINTARKPGRLHRLLSGARVPLGVYTTHTLEKGAAVSNVSQVAKETLHEHAGVPPNPVENYLESLGVAKDGHKSATVNKRPTNHDQNQISRDDGSSNMRTNQDKTGGFKSNFRIDSISSKLTRMASSVMAKNPIHKKSILTRTKPDANDTTSSAFDTPPRAAHGTLLWNQGDNENMGSVSQPSTSAEDRYGRSAATTGRSNSLSIVGASNAKIYDGTRHSSLLGQSEQHTIAFQKPSFQSQYLVSKTPPPVSMKTRNMGPLRVPPPIRPRSTPPVRSGAPTLSRKPSREGVQSYPPYNYPININHATMSQPPSQGNFYAYSAAQIQAYLNQPPNMLSNGAIRPSSAQYNVGGYRDIGGIPNSKHNITPSWEPPYDHSRRNSLASQTSQRSAISNTQPWSHYTPYDQPTLRHRSSYDGYSFQTQQNYGQDNGPYPSLPHSSGQAYVSDPLRGQPMLSQSRQYQQHARYVSRGHLRHHSLDQYGYPTPYRVLHSYNSPAYRGVPIWSG
ncbi:hypothetical protein GGR51DRAFT_492127 [Nemania sp. FL0031]|nr:hypothetical protein GGR51DRAFT_492127 [Nemania sp. FL0031]